MNVVSVFSEVAVVVSLLLAVGVAGIVGPDRIRSELPALRTRLRQAARPLLLLGAVLAANSVVRDFGVGLSWLIGSNITKTIYAIEGSFVASLQSLAPAWFTLYLGFVYVYGYAFLLVFPLVLTLLLTNTRYLRETAFAYTVNYVIGLLCYVLFVAYGPRNFAPDTVEPLLYDTIPRFQLVTSQINANTNVFPSLHTSLSVTVALMAYRLRAEYPRWLPVATCLAGSVVLSTMVLGIHWATDVVFGVLLGALSVYVATRPRFHSENESS
ncbi:phosphatase PAP2 family protein [Haloarcula sp. CGMCC 1.2071]|uniref:phosphatase PAP2 family protein n=1 Tax=Haloarcula sp. CGMCC 1.2071 TaxID=3111454 RepID=UPI00300EE06A